MLNPDELRRLREAAEIKACPPDWDATAWEMHQHFAWAGLVVYMSTHAAEIEEALRDGERLEWLAEMWTPSLDGSIAEALKGGYIDDIRAAIDEAKTPEPDEDIVRESTIPSPSQMAEIMRLK